MGGLVIKCDPCPIYLHEEGRIYYVCCSQLEGKTTKYFSFIFMKVIHLFLQSIVGLAGWKYYLLENKACYAD